MSNSKKAIKILLALVFVFGISYVPLLSIGENRAQVVSSFYSNIFSPSNTNETVLRAQTKLKELDLYSGRLSGLFGIRTKNAIIEFQKINNLEQNGILDIPTQNRLFNPVVVVPLEEIEQNYIVVGHTEEGNDFLSNWIYNNLRLEPGRAIELKGKISMNENSMLGSGAPYKFILYTENEKYSLENISTNDLSVFAGEYVLVTGFLSNRLNELGIPSFFINYIKQESDLDTRFEKVKEWVKEQYREDGVEILLSGTVYVYSEKTDYKKSGNFTNIIFYTENEKYSLENISSFDIQKLNGNKISIRGLLLEEYNPFGLKTIVVNYFEGIDEDGFVLIGYNNTQQENDKLKNWIKVTYNESGQETGMSGRLNIVRRSSTVLGGQEKDVIVLTTNDSRYSIENASRFDFSDFEGKQVKITGYLLNSYDGFGYRRIIINHNN